MQPRYTRADLGGPEAAVLLGIGAILAAFGYVIAQFIGLIIGIVVAFMAVHRWFQLVETRERFSLSDDHYVAEHGVIFKRKANINLGGMDQFRVTRNTRAGDRLTMQGENGQHSILISSAEKAAFKAWASKHSAEWNEGII